jgi:beta-lactam-binding protein with PASTA domain
VHQPTGYGPSTPQPFPRIPNVTSKNLTQAKRILRDAGFKVTVKKQNSITQKDGDIVSQDPPAGTEVRPGRTVTLVLIHNPCASSCY